MTKPPGLLPSVGVVVLTRGDRPVELRRALDSVLRQTEVQVSVVCVGNGWEPTDLPEPVRTVALPVNLGVGARNVGVPMAEGDLLFFLDDDAWLPEPDSLARIAAFFGANPKVGMVQTRILDPAGDRAPRSWVPRLRKGDASRPSTTMYVCEAAVGIRRGVFEQVGGWGEPYGYAHEGIELAWRVWDAGYIVWYAGDLVTWHPYAPATRHPEFQRQNARNRVLLTRRNLPALLAPGYLGFWSAVDGWRNRSDPEARREWLRGWRSGWREDPGPRRPLSWRGVLAMTRHGRPPII
ncbi:MAG: hypothetical protein QG671_478 [Actinomycetota bacterium]|nr:hypothetical protein [Actinomycetota bacterium]